MSFKDHFSGHAQAYAAYRPTWPKELVDALADASPGSARVWDVGCGSGQLSVLLTQRFREVVATDASAQQVAQATAHERVTYSVAKAEASGLAERSVDCIVAAQAAHWFDMEAFCAEALRVGRPGSLVALTSYALLNVRPDLDELINTFSDVTVGPYWPPERRHVDSGYRTLHFPFSEVQLPKTTMRARWSKEQLLGYLFTWSSVVAARKAGLDAAIDSFAVKFSQAWGDAPLLDVEWPLSVRAGRLP